MTLKNTIRSTAAASVCVLAAHANAGFIPSLISDAGTPVVTAQPGGTFSINLEFTTTPGGADGFDAAVFRMLFSSGGLAYNAGWYQWGAPFETGGLDDFSSPADTATGVLDANTHIDLTDPGAVDLAFENLTPTFGDRFTSGTLLTLTFTVPIAYAGPDTITVEFIPETFADGVNIIDVPNTEIFTIFIPAPSTALCFAFGAACMHRRRRSHTA